jgi:hypothetical protein
MPRRTSVLLVACLAGAMVTPLATTGAAQGQPGSLDRGFDAGGNGTTGLGRYRPDPGPGARTGGGTATSEVLDAPTTRPNSSCINSLPPFDFTP